MVDTPSPDPPARMRRRGTAATLSPATGRTAAGKHGQGRKSRQEKFQEKQQHRE